MKIKLKRATIKDLKFFYSLRNSKHNRKNFINTKKISFYEHSKWFEKAIMSKKDYLYKIIINILFMFQFVLILNLEKKILLLRLFY